MFKWILARLMPWELEVEAGTTTLRTEFKHKYRYPFRIMAAFKEECIHFGVDALTDVHGNRSRVTWIYSNIKRVA